MEPADSGHSQMRINNNMVARAGHDMIYPGGGSDEVRNEPDAVTAR